MIASRSSCSVTAGSRVRGCSGIVKKPSLINGVRSTFPRWANSLLPGNVHLTPFTVRESSLHGHHVRLDLPVDRAAAEALGNRLGGEGGRLPGAPGAARLDLAAPSRALPN